jgi:hypothetical protein
MVGAAVVQMTSVQRDDPGRSDRLRCPAISLGSVDSGGPGNDLGDGSGGDRFGDLPTRRLTSRVGWRFAVDVGLGAGATDFLSTQVRRFPGNQPSDRVPAWMDDSPNTVTIPSSPAFADLAQRGDQCGAIQIAGKAVGVPFVGVVAACLAIAETSRELLGGVGHDSLTYDLNTTDFLSAITTTPANVISAPLRT